MIADDLGNRIKTYEYQTRQKLIALLPVVIRLDGKGFHRFTKGLKRPYDKRLSDLMIETTEELVKETHAAVGYTQSDEITLVFIPKDYKQQSYFNGNVSKINSVLASFCTLTFNKALSKYLPEEYGNKNPLFDCRVFNVPTPLEAYNALLWREQDATRNSVQMAGHSEFSHNQLQNKSCNEIQEMLFSERNINWNDYPEFFKRGTFIRRKKAYTKYTAEELNRLPENHQAKKNNNLMVKRTVLLKGSSPQLTKLEKPLEWLFGEEDI